MTMYYTWYPVRLPRSPAEAGGHPGGGGGGGARSGEVRWMLQRREAGPMLSQASQELSQHRQWRQQRGQPQAGQPARPAVGNLPLPVMMHSESEYSEEVADAVNSQGGLSIDQMVEYAEAAGGVVPGGNGAAADVLAIALQREVAARQLLEREILRLQLQNQGQGQQGQQQAVPPQPQAQPQQAPVQQAAPRPRQQRHHHQAGAGAAAPAAVMPPGGGRHPRQALHQPAAPQHPLQQGRPRQAPRQQRPQPPQQHRRQPPQPRHQPQPWQHHQPQHRQFGDEPLPMGWPPFLQPQQHQQQGGGEASGMTDSLVPEPRPPQQRAAVAASLAGTAGGPDASDIRPPAPAAKRGRRQHPADSQAERQRRRLRQHLQPQPPQLSEEEGSADLHSRQGSAGGSEQDGPASCALGGDASAAICEEEPVPLVAGEVAAQLEAEAEAREQAAKARARRAQRRRSARVLAAAHPAAANAQPEPAEEAAAAQPAADAAAEPAAEPPAVASPQSAAPEPAAAAEPGPIAAAAAVEAAVPAPIPPAAAAPAAAPIAAPAPAAAAPASSQEQASQAEASASARAAAVAAAEAALPPPPGDQPELAGSGAGRLVSPEAWWQHKVAVQQWERRKRQREEGEAEVEAARAGKRRRQAGPPAPMVPGKPQLLPSVSLGPGGSPSAGGPAAKLLAEQRAALAAAANGRGRVSVPRAAAVVGAAKLAAAAAPRGRGGSRGVRGSRGKGAAEAAAAAAAEEEEQEQFADADMAMLRLQAPLLKQHRSPLHGWGMFAGQAIPRNAFVIEYTGEVVPDSVADVREKRYEAEGTGTMYLFRLDSQTVIDATRKGGAARYINHSCAPNCYTLPLHDIHTGRRCIAIFAGRDIAEGEELTYDYKIEREPDGEPLPCHCGASHCPGRMN